MTTSALLPPEIIVILTVGPVQVRAGGHLFNTVRAYLCVRGVLASTRTPTITYMDSRYQELLSKCKRKGVTPPKLEENTIVMRQAGGTNSDS